MESAIETCDLTVAFSTKSGPVKALNGLSMKVDAGQIFGFLGPNGAGKTTTMHILLGFIEASSGTAKVFGTDVRQSIARRKIGYLPEQPDTYRFLTGRELLSLTGRLFKMDKKTIRDRTGKLLNDVGIAEAADRRIGTYSRGMMQRICLAQALINDPDLVILDEPTGGLDPIGRMDIRKIITELRDQGKTVFFSSHELSEVELVCDHIAIMARGKIVAEGNAAELVPEGKSLEKFFMEVVGDSGSAGGAAPGETQGL
ncbi:MAG: ABC transporter ATP-binding protein [Kiritimatiellia bacterium]|jgi:ABC-2 type transport system ATP-binding protein|nr:ABC transporter ATP-binding protein [Kiritimatiellia bacterium]MDP6848047.1 ABC transporter ATP-binding protein [Kiritimatiellia bacterium]